MPVSAAASSAYSQVSKIYVSGLNGHAGGLDENMPSLRAIVQRFRILISVYCAAAIFVFSYYRVTFFRHVAKTGSYEMRLKDIETKSPKCGESPVQLSVDVHRQICRSLLRGDAKPRDRTLEKLPSAPSMTVNQYVELATADCDCFRSRLGYFTAADTTAEERAFPIAFSLLTYENLEQTERLLRLIYRPHNLYCIHVDRKSDPEMHRGVEAVAACLPNVMVVRPTISVTWGEITVVQAEMLCMVFLLAHSGVQWKYFINLVARDFPLRTNEELVKILKAYGGANDIQGTRNR